MAAGRAFSWTHGGLGGDVHGYVRTGPQHFGVRHQQPYVRVGNQYGTTIYYYPNGERDDKKSNT